MNSRVLFLTAALGLAVLAAALLVASTFVAARAPVDSAAQPVAEPASDIVARRLISIPFGIDTSLPIVQEGSAVLVSGHGTCPAGGERFELRATVEQQGTQAMGRTGGSCADGQLFTWQALAVAPPPQQLEPGPAQACGMVRIFFARAGTIVYPWCVSADLQ